MAAALVGKNPTHRTLDLLRQSFGFLRNFSAAASPPPPSPASGASPPASSKKPKRKKKKNLFEVAQFLPNWGIGYHMAKTHWAGVSYQITKINLYKDGRHGKAWGVVHKEGLPPADAPKKIGGVHKRCWRYIPNLGSASSSLPSSTKPTETPQAEAQAA
ncbi:uncharacterized protein LOC104422421 [Eucalyptus grandis]|uniref:Uncharacterized protein n=3 Tax=Eucalyptus TaxID=3932 RepID=A0ACC3J8A4_EUCGR|nr:uncharacterized protein LOC104422421 [Eucalyptus grandis]KAK3409889.1 hypothetical protein EUGRSUZ_J01954 [Eucalyptus grandis]